METKDETKFKIIIPYIYKANICTNIKYVNSYFVVVVVFCFFNLYEMEKSEEKGQASRKFFFSISKGFTVY